MLALCLFKTIPEIRVHAATKGKPSKAGYDNNPPSAIIFDLPEFIFNLHRVIDIKY